VTGWDGDGGAKFPTEEFVPVFGGYCEGPWFQHREELPPSVHSFFIPMRNDAAIGADLQVDPVGKNTGWRIPYELYPFATCELGGGIQVTHHRRPIVRPMDIYSISLVKLGCGNNLPGYYMFHGGTNPMGKISTMQETTETGYPNDYAVLSYDFQAPLSEYGEVRGQYRLLNQLHLFVQDFGELLAPMDAVMAAQTLNLFNNRCDIVDMANVAQLCNNLHSLYLAGGEHFVETPNYHVFDLYKGHQGGRQVNALLTSEVKEKEGFAPLEMVSASASVKENVLTLTLANLDISKSQRVKLSSVEGILQGEAKVRLLHHENVSTCNTFEDPFAIMPRDCTMTVAEGMEITLPAASVMAITLPLAE